MKRVKPVDGFKIRNTIDVDFSVIGDHSLYPYIERGEIWFDRAFIKEKDFFIKLFNDRSLLTKKFGYEQAKEILRIRPSMRFKMTERLPPSLIRRTSRVTKQFRPIKRLERTGSVAIYLVDGSTVRMSLDPNFCFGGHWKIYKYIPKNEIWIDSAVLPRERKYVIIHEMHELKLMKKGMSYNNAHDFASAAEKSARRNDGVGHYLKD